MTEPAERRKSYLQRKKSGLCPRCGTKKKKTCKFSYCDDCREYYRNYNIENTVEIQSARRLRYTQRIEKKCCPKCGKKLEKKSKNIICPQCLKKQYSYNK